MILFLLRGDLLKTVTIYVARVLTASALMVSTAIAASYQASVHVSLIFPDPVANVLGLSGSEFNLVSDYLSPTRVVGNAGFSPFSATQSFRSGRLELDIGG